MVVTIPGLTVMVRHIIGLVNKPNLGWNKARGGHINTTSNYITTTHKYTGLILDTGKVYWWWLPYQG